jgi:CheY-like chemotaxis protein
VKPQSHAKPVVLIVEDEPLLRMLAVDLVEEAGFEAVEAAGATEAIVILETRADIRIVFSDIDMPGGMDGMRLAACIRDRWPPIDIVLTSGMLREKDVDLPPRGVFFAKPYNMEAVVATLRAMATA